MSSLVVRLSAAAILTPLLLVAPQHAQAQPPSPAVAVTDGIETETVTRPVAPGLELTSFDRYGADGWLRADALTADLAGGLEVDRWCPTRW